MRVNYLSFGCLKACLGRQAVANESSTEKAEDRRRGEMRDERGAILRSLVVRLALYLIVCVFWGGVLRTDCVYADTSYYQHSFFDNSLTPDAYYYSSGKA